MNCNRFVYMDLMTLTWEYKQGPISIPLIDTSRLTFFFNVLEYLRQLLLGEELQRCVRAVDFSSLRVI